MLGRNPGPGILIFPGSLLHTVNAPAMQNPFPGMNPYLEQAELWHQVHHRLIIAITDALTPQILPQ
jgi:hypothetical protein